MKNSNQISTALVREFRKRPRADREYETGMTTVMRPEKEKVPVIPLATRVLSAFAASRILE